MPPRLNALSGGHAPSQAGEAVEAVAAQVENLPEPRATPAVPSRFTAIARHSQRAANLLANSFRSHVLSQPSQSASAVSSQANASHLAQLNTAVDQWAQTQHHLSPRVCSEIKDAIHGSNADRIFKNTRATTSLFLTRQGLHSFPPEIGQATALNVLSLDNNLLTDIPVQIGQLTNLTNLGFGDNLLTSVPAEIGLLKNLAGLELKNNQLRSIPEEIGQIATLRHLDLSGNQVTFLPESIGQALNMRHLQMQRNNLTELPHQIADLTKLRFLNLSYNQFVTVPQVLFHLPPSTEIDLRHNPLPEAEILAARATIEQRRNANLKVPQFILPVLAGEAGELRDAAANNMNVHTTVLTNAFKARLDIVAKQFPDQFNGDTPTQHTQLNAVEARLMHTLDIHLKSANPKLGLSAKETRHAYNTASAMFKQGRGERSAYANEFRHSTGHVLAYTFLAIEAQWAQTPQTDIAKARHNGMDSLLHALNSGSGMCDTRLCEEVMQIIGVPLSPYAQAHPEIIAINPLQTSHEQTRDVVLAEGRYVLRELTKSNPAIQGDAQPPMWRAQLMERLLTEHPALPPNAVETTIAQIESMWETFHDLSKE